jgi:hypothetical protein
MNARHVPPIDALEGTDVPVSGGGHIRRVVSYRLAIGTPGALFGARVRDRASRSTHALLG